MGSYTTNLNLYKPANGEKGWDALVNANFDTLDNYGGHFTRASGIITPTTAGDVIDVYNASGGNDYVRLYHDDTYGVVKSFTGTVKLEAESGANINDTTDTTCALGLSLNGIERFSIRANKVTAEGKIAVHDVVGNQLILTNWTNMTSDHDHAAQTNPTLYVHSDKDPDTLNTEWVSTTHNQTYGLIESGKGAMMLQAASNVAANCATGNILSFGLGILGTQVVFSRINSTWGQYIMAIGDEVGNQLVLTNSAHQTLDHDHDVQTNPTLYIQSDTSPTTNNTQFLSLAHNKTDAVIASGKGGILITAPKVAPTIADLSQLSFYLDESGHNLKVAVQYSDSTTKTATIAFD